MLLMQPDLEMPRFGKDTTAAVELNGEPAPKGIQNCADLALMAWEAFEPHAAPNRHAHRAAGQMSLCNARTRLCDPGP